MEASKVDPKRLHLSHTATIMSTQFFVWLGDALREQRSAATYIDIAYRFAIAQV